MGTTTTIHIEGAQQLTEAKLNRAIERAGLEDVDVTELPDDAWVARVETRWTSDQAHQLAADLSTRHPAARVTVTADWNDRDADQPGCEVSVYIGGKHREEFGQTQGMVPNDLDEAIAAVREALGGGDLAAAATWLIDGLEGTRRDPEPVPEPVTVTSVAVVDEWGTDYSDLIRECFDFSEVRATDRRQMVPEDAWQLTTRESINRIVERWTESAAQHAAGAYTWEWIDSADAYVIGGWDGDKPALRTIHDDGEGRGAIPFDGLVDGLSLTATITWSDGEIS